MTVRLASGAELSIKIGLVCKAREDTVILDLSLIGNGYSATADYQNADLYRALKSKLH